MKTVNEANDSRKPDAERRFAGAPGSASKALQTLDDFCHLPEGEWASNLSNAELADELIANLWADIPARERKKAAVLEAAIDRLRARDAERQAEARRRITKTMNNTQDFEQPAIPPLPPATANEDSE